jgi:Mg2+-importing ATPase
MAESITTSDVAEYSRYSLMSHDELFNEFNSSEAGIPEREAYPKIKQYGYNDPIKKHGQSRIIRLLSKFTNPLIIVLLFIGVFTLLYAEKITAVIIFCMVLISIFIEFFQENVSENEVEKLIELVRVKTTVVRSGQRKKINIKDLVPGDVVELSAGDLIPADIRIIASKDLFINASALTGESFPIGRTHEIHNPIRPQSVNDLTNIAMMGTSIVSGTATAIVIKTGKHTEFSHIARSIAKNNQETSFDRGIRNFMWMMIKFILVLTICTFAVNAILKGRIVESLIFSLAVAVGLTPELLPMIVTVNLARGAKAMSKKDVIVKRLDSIQNLGAMDVLCTDKTGTLTEDKIVLEKYCDVFGKENDEVLKYAYMNSHFQAGMKNILDEAILNHRHAHWEDTLRLKKRDEIPFDFSRKIMSVVLEEKRGEKLLMISKGAPEEILARSKKYELNGKVYPLNKKSLKKLNAEYESLSGQGFRVLAIAYKYVDEQESYDAKDEKGFVVKGYIGFLDPPKQSAREAIHALRELGISIKILTGDNEIVTKKICSEVGLEIVNMLRGNDIDQCNDIELRRQVETTTVFTRLTPFQKERIIRALQENNHTVGFLGDGINDAPTLKRADVGISVNNSVDVAKESAGLILLNKNLTVLKEGVIEGRKVFGNLVKYIQMSASSNFGNMLSVAGASLFLPFLPLLPIQIIFNNFLYDMSQLSIASDNVDKEYIKKPRQWNIDSIKRFMISLGPVSSLFDFLTFGVLLYVLHSSVALFQTMWFLESICTQVLVVYIIRTNKIPFIESRPSPLVLIATLIICSIAVVVTTTTIGEIFGFITLGLNQLMILLGILIAYMVATYFVKTSIFQRYMID